MSKIVKLLNKAEEVKNPPTIFETVAEEEKDASSESMSNFSKLFMLIACAVAVMSLVMNYQAVKQVSHERTYAQSLRTDLKLQKEKIRL